jgi:hypothetical protein
MQDEPACGLRIAAPSRTVTSEAASLANGPAYIGAVRASISDISCIMLRPRRGVAHPDPCLQVRRHQTA